MQHVLIVDDSKVARMALGKMLDKLSIDVDMVESGEEALDYLQNSSPSIIFMDHMMPGMDGFQAVKAIKSNPDKAHIPIVMHTTRSTEGGVYIGQARALGAEDILSKPASDEELSKVLERLQLRSADTAADLTPVHLQVVMSDDLDSHQHRNTPTQGDITLPQEAVSTTHLTATQSHQSDQFQTGSFEVAAVNAELKAPAYRQILSSIILMAPIVLLLTLYFPVEQQRKDLLEQENVLYGAIEWAANLSGEYDYGELPLAGKRFELLEGMVVQLLAANFVGTVQVESHIGAFCLVDIPLADNTVVKMLPMVDMPLSECESIGLSQAEAVEESGRQSVEFKAFLTQSPLLTTSNIKVEVIQYGTSSPVNDYPIDIQNISAGDWNAVALSNNRVNFSIIPDRDSKQLGGLWSMLFAQ